MHMTLQQLVLGYILAINIVTLFVFGADKLSARADAWRIRERTLLILAALGGSPGALLAMKLFRHKTAKPSFGILLAAILALQIVFVWYILSIQ